jgi:hypothetical protein
MAEKRKVMLKTSPDHIFRALWPVTPSCSTYSGRKGITRLKAAPVKKQPNHATARLRFQFMGTSEADIAIRMTIKRGNKPANYAPA